LPGTKYVPPAAPMTEKLADVTPFGTVKVSEPTLSYVQICGLDPERVPVDPHTLDAAEAAPPPLPESAKIAAARTPAAAVAARGRHARALS
jgi:hypothetical protein